MDLLRGPTVQRHRHQLGRDRKCQETQPGSGEGVWDWQDGEKSVTAGELGLSGDTDNEMNCLLMDHYYSYAWVALIVKSCVRCKTWWWLLMNVGWRKTELTPVMLSMIVWSHDNIIKCDFNSTHLLVLTCAKKTYLLVLKCIFMVRAAVSPPSSRLSSDVVDSLDSPFNSRLGEIHFVNPYFHPPFPFSPLSNVVQKFGFLPKKKSNLENWSAGRF